MSSKSKFPEVNRQLLIKALECDLTIPQMASMFGKSRQGIHWLLKREGLHKPTPVYPYAVFSVRLTPRDIDAVVKLKVKYACKRNSETIRMAIRKAAVVAGVLKEERE